MWQSLLGRFTSPTAMMPGILQALPVWLISLVFSRLFEYERVQISVLEVISILGTTSNLFTLASVSLKLCSETYQTWSSKKLAQLIYCQSFSV